MPVRSCWLWVTLLLSAAWGSSALEAIQQVDSKSQCGYSKITSIKCWMQSSSEVLPFVVRMSFHREDGSNKAWCPVPSAGSNRQVTQLTLVPGDSIYSVRVCYDPTSDNRIVGIMFGGVAKQYICGNVWMRPERCLTSNTLVPAPLSYFGGVCNSIYTRMDTVCWNKWYRPKASTQTCLVGEGVQSGAPWCQPCGNGTYNPGGLATCASCGDGEVTPGACCTFQTGAASGAAVCSCQPGEGLHPQARKCSPCKAGYYSPGGALSPCIACPLPFMTTPSRAATIEECVCMPGYGYRSGTGSCAICPKGYYGTGLKDSSYVVSGRATLVPCQSCPENTSTARPEATSEKLCKAA